MRVKDTICGLNLPYKLVKYALNNRNILNRRDVDDDVVGVALVAKDDISILVVAKFIILLSQF